MLRTKQLGTLSHSARSFFLTGSRCSAADGSSSTCSEDETCISKRPLPGIGVQNPQTTSTLVPETAVRVGSVVSGVAVKVLNSDKSKTVDYPTSLPEVISTSSTTVSADTVSYAVENDMTNTSPFTTGQLFRAGIEAVNFLSDLVNYKIPQSDGSGMLNSPQNCMVDRTRAVSSIKPSNIKNYRKDNIQGKSSAEASTARSNSTTNSNVTTRGRSDKYSSSRGVNNVQYYGAQHSDAQDISLDPHDRRSVPLRSKDSLNHFTANARTPDLMTAEMGPPRKTRVPKAFPQMARQYSSSGRVVESVSQILHQLKWGPAAEEALLKLNVSMDVYQANQVLKQLQDHSVAVGFFYWLKRQAGFKHDGHTYTTMVGILGRAKQFGAINKLLDQMVRDGCRPNVVTYNRLIHSYGRANFLNKSLDVFNQMQKAGCEPDRVTYCTLIDIHAKAGYLDVAMDMYQRMQEAGLSPDTFTYSVIINCLGKAGHLVAAHKLFCEMVNQGCVPNLVTYNIMIALQAKARNYETALQLYRDMQNAGFEPDKVTYSIVMEVLGHCGYLEEAEAVFAEMKRKNWIPDEPVYGLLVDLWGKAGNAEKAWAWYSAMLKAGLRPNVPICNSLLSAFLRVHRLSDAYNLVQSMHSLGLSPSVQTYTLLLSCCTEAQTSFDMTFCCELMGVTGHPAHMFLLSMPAAGPDGQNVRDHVGKFLDLMHSEDRESKRGLVDAVVDFLHKSGLKEEAGSVWEVAAQKNVYPDAVREKSSCYWLINLHVMSDGTAVTALSRTLAWFRRQMLVSGIRPSRIDIVTGWGRRSRVTGTSLVRQSVQELLSIFSFPFFTENGNSGCFVGCGEPLNRWLLQSYVERMHLL